METCVFCRQINDGSLKNRTIYEDAEFIGFLDGTNLVKGHTLLIPKKHVQWVWDYPDIGLYFQTVKTIIEHFRKVFQTDRVYSLISGDQVPHAHIHILPHTSGVWIENFGPMMKEMRSKLTEEDKKIDPQFIEQVKMK